MGRTSKKKRKAKKARRPQPVGLQEGGDGNRRIGWFAHRGLSALCDGDACVVTATRQVLQQLTDRMPGVSWTIRATTLAEVWQGLSHGGAYALDQGAYQLLMPFARQRGVPLDPEDFSDPGPTGLHLVRIQIGRPGWLGRLFG